MCFCIEQWSSQARGLARFVTWKKSSFFAQHMFCICDRRYRYTAYRQFVRWCWGYLGKEVRVVLPSCVVTKIRNAYASAQYKGFQLPPLNWRKPASVSCYCFFLTRMLVLTTQVFRYSYCFPSLLILCWLRDDTLTQESHQVRFMIWMTKLNM